MSYHRTHSPFGCLRYLKSHGKLRGSSEDNMHAARGVGNDVTRLLGRRLRLLLGKTLTCAVDADAQYSFKITRPGIAERMATQHGFVKIIATDSQFHAELEAAGSKLVVIDFHATWCGPCQRIAPVYVKYSTEYPQAVFLKVDVDQCPLTAEKYGVTSMPTFVFLRHKVKVDQFSGADPNQLRDKIKQHLGGEVDSADDVGVPGHMDLVTFLNKQGCTCLNESDDHPHANAFKQDDSYLESDCDEQLLLTVSFSQSVKLHSLRIRAPDDGRGPKTIKIFTNQPNQLDFDRAEQMEGLQKLDLAPEDLSGEKVIPLRFVKFQNVNSATFFIANNQGGEETTVIKHFQIIGSPIEATNMKDFKRATDLYTYPDMN